MGSITTPIAIPPLRLDLLWRRLSAVNRRFSGFHYDANRKSNPRLDPMLNLEPFAKAEVAALRIVVLLDGVQSTLTSPVARGSRAEGRGPRPEREPSESTDKGSPARCG